MGEKDGKQERERRPDQREIAADWHERSVGKRKPRISRVFLWGGMFTFLAAWAGLLGNLGHGFWVFAACMMGVASIFFAAGLRLELRNHHWPKWQYNGLFVVIILSTLALSTVGIVREILRPEPHFIFSITSELAPVDPAFLTNSSLTVKNDGAMGNFSPLLLIPSSDNHTPVRSRFDVHVLSAVTVDTIESTISMPEGMGVVMGNGWQLINGPIKLQSQGGKYVPMKTFFFKAADKLMGGEPEVLPEITFETTKPSPIFPTGCFPISMSVRGDKLADSKPTDVALVSFWLYIGPVYDNGTNLLAPRIVKNTDVQINSAGVFIVNKQL